MKFPQTAIKKFNDSTCLFMCYLYCIGIEPDKLSSWMRYYADALDKGVLSEEGYVLDGEKLLYLLTGKKYTIEKAAIDSIKDLKGPYPVQYVCGDYGHFVVVENGEIVFNPLEYSNCVTNGRPASARILKLK